jgi:hypothetical protein
MLGFGMGESFRNFYTQPLPHMGLMAQCEQTTLYFDVTSEAEQAGYIDLSSAMTAANRKQYHQVARNGKALCYTVRVRAIKGQVTFKGLSSAFITCNAVKQAGAGWKAQLRHAGVKLKDLSPMGRRPRFALTRFQQQINNRTELGVDDPVFEISAINLKPLQAPGGAGWFSTYTSTDGKSVSYHSFATPTVDNISANQVTQVTVTDGAGTESNRPMVMCGNGPSEFSVLEQYMKARRQTPDVSIDTPGPDGHSEMLNLFSIAEELSDDIVEGVEHYMDYKPYTPDHETNNFDDMIQLGNVSSTTSGTGTSTNETPTTGNTSTSEVTNYPPSTDIFEVPLGMMELAADSASCNLQVDVLAIYEM